MASLLQLPLGGLVLLSVLTASARADVNPDAAPFKILYGTNGSVGPDGPWWFIPQAIDFPDQYVQLLPSISELSLIVNREACDDSTTCPLPLPMMWQRSGAWDVSGGNITISDDVDASKWDQALSSLLAIEGRGRYFADRLTLHKGDDPYYLEGSGMMLSDSYAATFPGGQTYTFDTGFFSLFGESETARWNAENGTSVRFDRTLPLAYQNGFIPSISYGLHVGSVYPKVNGSLVLGGYDSSRAISDPIISEDDTFTLNTIGLDALGGYMYYGEVEPDENQLTTPGMDVNINPGAPYMYLPKPTCDKIAEYLGATYDEDFNLYMWDRSDDAFRYITSSLHFLTFGFASSNNRTQKINVPFGVLNLTLESPLVSEPTPYFPCSPLQTGQTATLGRAFLQAAFLAQNWQIERIFLSQAPGPDYEPENLLPLGSDDTQLTPATNPPSWSSTWTSTLPPWDDINEEDGGGGGLSGGVIAGIVVGCIAFLAIVAGLAIWFLRRRKHRKSWTKPGDAPAELAAGRQSRAGPQGGAYGDGSTYAYFKNEQQRPTEIYEAEAPPPRQEMDSSQQIGELPAGDGPRHVWKR